MPQSSPRSVMIRSVLLTVVAGVAPCVLGFSLASERPGGSMDEALDARDLLRRMARAYRECHSYRDTGTVRTVFGSKSGSWTEDRPFRTAFVRPERFRFEFTDRSKRYIIWRNGADIRIWWDLDGRQEKAGSLNDAVAGATGVSGGSAHTIPALLMPDELRGWRLTELDQPSRLPDAPLGQTTCFRVEGKALGNSQTVWLDKTTYLVRRIDERMPPHLGGEQTTTYDPMTNTEIGQSELSFGVQPAR
jgi:hypothetical protein